MPTITGFDITQAAQAYSAVAGILAGFAFAVLVWLIEHLVELKDKDTGERSDGAKQFVKQALIFLGVTFASNVITAILWALVSGESEPNTTRPTILSFFATLNFALATPLTIASIIFILASTKVRQVIPIFRQVFGVAVVVSSFYLLVTITNIWAIQARSNSQVAFTENLWWLLLFLLVQIVVFFISYLINTKWIGRLFWWSHDESFNSFVKAWLLAILLSTLGFGYIALLGTNVYLPTWLIFIAVAYWTVLMGWAITFLPSESNVEKTASFEESGAVHE